MRAGPMAGENDLSILLRDLRPRLDRRRFVFCSPGVEATVEIAATSALATIREAEGLSVILEQHEADALGWAYQGTWARVTLEVWSDLAAVGLIARVATALAAAEVPANPVAGYYHDHLFVPWDRRHEAVAILEGLSDPA